MEQGITWEDRVKGAYASLRPSEQKVAEFFLAHAEELEDLTIGELARGAGVSEPTVIRCVRGLGYRGYREFKGALSQKEGQVRGNALDYLGGLCPAALGADGGPPPQGGAHPPGAAGGDLEVGAHRGTGAGRPDPGRGAIH